MPTTTMDASAAPEAQRVRRAFIVAWMICVAFYFLEYAVRSSPAVMIPELARQFGVSPVGVSGILGVYYYTYASLSLVAGLLLDRYGAKYIVPAGALVLGLGCLLFSLPSPLAGNLGRLLQGGGSAFAFTGAVYLAAHGLPGGRLATAIGITQCLGMLGGSAGQLGVGPLIHGLVTVPVFWVLVGVLVLVAAIALMRQTPREGSSSKVSSTLGTLGTYMTVLSNPQTYLCGLIAGLLFAPTTVLDMIWGVRYLEQDRQYGYQAAVVTVSMVPLGWAIGCPILGTLADAWGRRKAALRLGILVMLACLSQLAFFRGIIPAWSTLLVFGIGSGAAMIPYTIIKEVNPDEVKGTATGVMNFITFSVTALLGPIFAHYFGSTLGLAADHDRHVFATLIFWISAVGAALVLTPLLKETGHRTAPQKADRSALTSN